MKKILVANRDSHSCENCPKMGIKTVAVYSTIDRNAPHVKFADEAVWIGRTSNQSYLLGDKIIVAKELGRCHSSWLWFLE
jgi:propionyl-CoA carboxylase alpha chain